MKKALLIAAAVGLFAAPALAQTAAPSVPPATPDAPPAATAAPGVDVSKMRPRDVLDLCLGEIAPQGLRGAAHKAAVEDCFLKKRPDLAEWEKCRTAPDMEGKTGDERRLLMRACMGR